MSPLRQEFEAKMDALIDSARSAEAAFLAKREVLRQRLLDGENTHSTRVELEAMSAEALKIAEAIEGLVRQRAAADEGQREIRARELAAASAARLVADLGALAAPRGPEPLPAPTLVRAPELDRTVPLPIPYGLA